MKANRVGLQNIKVRGFKTVALICYYCITKIFIFLQILELSMKLHKIEIPKDKKLKVSNCANVLGVLEYVEEVFLKPI